MDNIIEISEVIKTEFEKVNQFMLSKGYTKGSIHKFRASLKKFVVMTGSEKLEDLENMEKGLLWLEIFNEKIKNNEFKKITVAGYIRGLRMYIDYYLLLQKKNKRIYQFQDNIFNTVFDKFQYRERGRKQQIKYNIKNLSENIQEFITDVINWLEKDQKRAYQTCISYQKDMASFCVSTGIENLKDLEDESKIDVFVENFKEIRAELSIELSLKNNKRFIEFHNEIHPGKPLTNAFQIYLDKRKLITQKMTVNVQTKRVNYKFEDFSQEIKNFWQTTYEHFRFQGLTKKTLMKIKSAFKSFVFNAEVSKIKEFEDLNKAENFVKTLEQMEYNTGTIVDYLLQLNKIIHFYITLGQFKDNFGLKMNPFEYILKIKYKNIKNVVEAKSHKAREKIEVETWIKLINEPRMKIYWILLAMGLRKTEAAMIKEEQFDLNAKLIINLVRKNNLESGKISQKRISIPDWAIKTLKQNFPIIQSTKSYFVFNPKATITRWSKRHLIKLLKLKEELEKDSIKLNNPSWQQILLGIQKLEENSYITPHQLRATWDTLSNGRMDNNFRMYHLNHKLTGMDSVYVQIAENDDAFNDYANDLNTNSPYYQI